MGLQGNCKARNFLEDTVKRAVALLVLTVMSAMLFACGSPASTTAPAATLGSDTAATSAATSAPKPVVNAVVPYADIDFFFGETSGEFKDNKGVITLEIKANGENSVRVEETTVKFMGVERKMLALRITETGAWVKGTFSEFENNLDFDAFVARNGGFSIEAFYLDNSTTKANRGIVCSTESIGGDAKRSGWGLAENASGAPYFITGHTAENEYSSVYATSASKEELVHVVGVYNAITKRNAIYVNGTLVSSDSAAGAFTSANKTEAYEGFNMATIFYIGADPSASAGKADECDFPSNDLTVIDVKIYACALDDAAVKAAFAKSTKDFY